MPNPRRSAPSFIAVVAELLRRGGIGVLPTDTLYGLVAPAFKKDTVERLYAVRRRNPRKPMIILIADIKQLARFGVPREAATRKVLRKAWPGPVSVVLPIAPRRRGANAKWKYLHRGTGTLAFRLPAPQWLRALLRQTGPLVAPSANPEGRPPARTIAAAKKYFHDQIEFYVDAGRLAGRPSTLLEVRAGKVKVLRPGAGWYTE